MVANTTNQKKMADIIRNRTIRPSTRLEKSKSYKIDTRTVLRGDTLIVNIDHESKPFVKTYKFTGSDIDDKNSISFRVNEFKNSIDLSWSGAKPIGNGKLKHAMQLKTPKPFISKVVEKVISKTNSKTSFEPISNPDTTVLILGTLPGDKSLDLGEYYGHPRNKFWKIISTITNNELPITYSDKKKLLLKTKMGIWDVAHKANRKGSLDSEIINEEPNDLVNFIKRHKNLKVIGFNGTKSKVLFDKYFNRESEIKYISLPSTSPANTGIDFNGICEKWRPILNNE